MQMQMQMQMLCSLLSTVPLSSALPAMQTPNQSSWSTSWAVQGRCVSLRSREARSRRPFTLALLRVRASVHARFWQLSDTVSERAERGTA